MTSPDRIGRQDICSTAQRTQLGCDGIPANFAISASIPSQVGVDAQCRHPEPTPISFTAEEELDRPGPHSRPPADGHRPSVRRFDYTNGNSVWEALLYTQRSPMWRVVQLAVHIGDLRLSTTITRLRLSGCTIPIRRANRKPPASGRCRPGWPARQQPHPDPRSARRDRSGRTSRCADPARADWECHT